MEKLGIQTNQLIFQAVNFSIMVFVLTRILYRPILKILEERKKKIEEGLKFSQKMAEELEKIEQKKKKVIDEAKEEGRKIIEENKVSGKNIEKQILQKANFEAEAILEKGKKEVGLLKSEMEQQLKIQTTEIATLMVQKLLTQVLSLSDHRQIINQKISEIEKISK